MDPAAADIARARDTVAKRVLRKKREIRHRRDELRLLAQRLDALDEQLAAFGIVLEVNTQPKGGHSGSINGGEAETI